MLPLGLVLVLCAAPLRAQQRQAALPVPIAPQTPVSMMTPQSNLLPGLASSNALTLPTALPLLNVLPSAASMNAVEAAKSPPASQVSLPPAQAGTPEFLKKAAAGVDAALPQAAGGKDAGSSPPSGMEKSAETSAEEGRALFDLSRKPPSTGLESPPPSAQSSFPWSRSPATWGVPSWMDDLRMPAAPKKPVVAAPRAPLDRKSLLKTARRVTQGLVERHLERRKDGVRESKVVDRLPGRVVSEFSGVPERVARLETSGRVFRHWAKDPETIRTILEDGALRAGKAPYVEFTGLRDDFVMKIFPELTGAFFTTPSHYSGEARVMNLNAPYFIDIRVPDGIEALSLDGDSVLMFPAETGTMIPVDIVGSSELPPR